MQTDRISHWGAHSAIVSFYSVTCIVLYIVAIGSTIVHAMSHTRNVELCCVINKLGPRPMLLMTSHIQHTIIDVVYCGARTHILGGKASEPETSQLVAKCNFYLWYLHLAPLFVVIPTEFQQYFWQQKTRVPGLLHCVILRSAILVARASPQQCTQSTPDFIQIGSLLAEVPNA